jgi:integrase/recombinase XerD
VTGLRAVLADYLALRRALGYRLAMAERLLGQFLDFMDAEGAGTITADLAVRWAAMPSGTSPGWRAQRLSAVRQFAVFAASLDEAVQVPPAGCLPGRPARAVPYIYSDAEIEAIMAAARSLPSPLLAATYETLVGLLAVTGMFSGGPRVATAALSPVCAAQKLLYVTLPCATGVVQVATGVSRWCCC